MIRPATPDDAPWLARIHIQARQETYADLLPADQVAPYSLDQRTARWRNILGSGGSCVMVLPELGFASTAPQRDADRTAQGYPFEVYSLYLLRAVHGQGHGRALLRAAWTGGPATVTVLAGNPAVGFYIAVGARLLDQTGEDQVYAWDAATLP